MAGEHWYLGVLRDGVEPANEANTSRLVHEVLLTCLEWPLNAIVAQAGKKGFIDYELVLTSPPARIRVEVKPYQKPLKEEHIRKYLVAPGRTSKDLRFGVITNLAEWEFYVAGQEVKDAYGDRMIRIRRLLIENRKDIGELQTLLAHRNNGRLRKLRAAIADSEDLLVALLREEDSVLRAVRQSLEELRDRYGLEAAVPQYGKLSTIMKKFFSDEPFTDCPFTPAKLRQAIRKPRVADAVNDYICKKFDARSQAATIKNTIAAIVTQH